jgi:hypothetical protein
MSRMVTPANEHATLLDDYADKRFTVEQIAKRHGMSTSQVTYLAKKNALPLRGRGRTRRAAPSATQRRILKMVEKQTFLEVAKAMGTTKQNIGRVVKRWGKQREKRTGLRLPVTRVEILRVQDILISSDGLRHYFKCGVWHPRTSSPEEHIHPQTQKIAQKLWEAGIRPGTATRAQVFRAAVEIFGVDDALATSTTTSMRSVISFRVTDQDMRALKKRISLEPGRISVNQMARRLLRDCLVGPSPRVSAPVETSMNWVISFRVSNSEVRELKRRLRPELRTESVNQMARTLLRDYLIGS